MKPCNGQCMREIVLFIHIGDKTVERKFIGSLYKKGLDMICMSLKDRFMEADI